MENEEKAKVIIDYDKYQELLAKANLNEKAIQEIKDIAYKDGCDYRHAEYQELEAKYAKLKSNFKKIDVSSEKLMKTSYNHGFVEGCRVVHYDVNNFKKTVIAKLDDYFKMVPANSIFKVRDIYANDNFCNGINALVTKCFDYCLEEKKSMYED
nr:MAG: hypothetical protein [Bacteriophage sp.]